MDSEKMMILAPMLTLMTLWLVLVVTSAVLAFQKWQHLQGSLKKQMLYLWLGATIVFTGDSLHSVAATISTLTDNPTGPITILGSVFEFRTFAMFFDALVFMVYYTLWAFFITVRYQQGQLKPYDKISIGLAAAAMLFLLPGAVPNAFGIYTLDYNIAPWAPHIILFEVFGVMTVWKLIRCSRHALKHTSDPITQTQERALSIAGTGFLFSFLFFFLFLALAQTSIFMILKTFAYMTAFFYLIKGVILPIPGPERT
jgi:hypothetical protein